MMAIRAIAVWTLNLTAILTAVAWQMAFVSKGGPSGLCDPGFVLTSRGGYAVPAAVIVLPTISMFMSVSLSGRAGRLARIASIVTAVVLVLYWLQLSEIIECIGASEAMSDT